jgi:hypothetical protein
MHLVSWVHGVIVKILLATTIRHASTRTVGAMASAPLEELARRLDHSWVRHLQPDPETEKFKPNQSSRQVQGRPHFALARLADMMRWGVCFPHVAGEIRALRDCSAHSTSGAKACHPFQGNGR